MRDATEPKFRKRPQRPATFLFPTNLQVAAIKGPLLSLSLSGDEAKQARIEPREGEGSFSGGQLSGIHCTRLPPPPLVEITHARSRSLPPAFLSGLSPPHPKQTEEQARICLVQRTPERASCRSDVAASGSTSRSTRKRFLDAGTIAPACQPADCRRIAISLSLLLAFIGLMNSIVISTANGGGGAV